jgi:hypothetical protein
MAPLCLALLVGVGCSSKPVDDGKVAVKGKLVDNGKPLTLDPSKIPLPKGATGIPPGTGGTAIFQVLFTAADGNESTPAQTHPETATFEARLKPGKYKIAITAKFGFSPDAPDYFKGIFAADKTPIIRDIKAGDEIVIDVSKPQG